MEKSVADVIRAFAAKEYIQSARRNGLRSVQIRAGDVHRALRLPNLVPSVCSALRSKIFLEQNRIQLQGESGPPSGMGTRMTFTYRLLDDKETNTATKEDTAFGKLRGLLKEALAELGGGEAFLRRERQHFYESDAELKK